MRRALFLLLAALTLALAGCGGGGSGNKAAGKPLTKAEYQAKLREISSNVGSSIGKTTNSKTISKADVNQFVKALDDFADQIERVNPPAAIKDLHNQLVAALRQLAHDFPGIAEQLRSAKDASAAIAALFGAKSIQALARIQQQLKAKGYDLNLNG
jgi:hypothetical protein